MTEHQEKEEIGNHYFSKTIKGEKFSFNSGHFLTSCRESLHGHTYKVMLKAKGTLNSKGMVFDTELFSNRLEEICKHFDKKVIIPMNSPDMNIRIKDDYVFMSCIQDKSEFKFPASTCCLVNIQYSSVEDLSQYMLEHFLADLMSGYDYSNIESFTMYTEESPGQWASFTKKVNKK